MPKDSVFERLYKEFKHDKKTIIIIDTDTGFLERFDVKLKEQFLKDTLQIYPYPPETTRPTKEIIEECLNEVKKLKGDGIKLWAIFVDVVLIEKGPGPLDNTGVEVANQLKAIFPDIPVFNVTAKFETDAEIALVSEATVEDTDGVLFKGYLEGKYFSANSLNRIVAKASANYSKRIAATSGEPPDHILTGASCTIGSTPKRIFIGHGRSPLWRELKDFIAERLGLAWDEFNREAVAGHSTADRLKAMMSQTTFAFLVMTAEEEHTDTTIHARPNVIHELGLFQGRLGLNRAIVVLEEGCSEFSNIVGLSQIRFPHGDIRARFEEVRQVLEREGLL
jgi:predicted nucleotide-binding protein